MSITLDQFAAKHGIPLTLESTYKGKFTKYSWEHFRWRCILRFGSREYKLYFRLGIGHQGRKNLYTGKWDEASWEQIKENDRALKYGERIVSRYKPTPPSLPGVLSSLQSDYFSIQNDPLWADFANANGYDTDSRSAHKVYKACRKAYLRLNKFFGNAVSDFLDVKTD